MNALIRLKQCLDRAYPSWQARWCAYAIIALAVVLLAGAIFSGCAATNDKAGEAALVGAGAAGGAAAGGPLWAGVVAGVVSFWNWLGGGSPEAGRVIELGLFGRLGSFIDRAMLWCAVGLVAAWMLFPRTRGAILDFTLGIPKAIAAFLKRDAPAAKVALQDTVLAPFRLAGVVGEPVSRRLGRAKKKSPVVPVPTEDEG